MPLVRVLVAEDNDAFAAALEYWLDADGGFEVVGRAVSGTDVAALAAERSPDVVTMDVRMPGMDGLEATTVLRRRFPRLPVVILTGGEPDAEAAFAAGAVASIPKDDVMLHLTPVLRAVAQAAAQFAAA